MSVDRMNNIFEDVLTKQGGIIIAGNGEDSWMDLSYGYHPAITGYVHCYIDGISPMLPAIGKTLKDKSFNNGFACLARGFTLPEVSHSEITYTGMLNIREPGELVQGSEISIRFIDTLDLALTNFFTNLFYAMRPLPLVGADESYESQHSNLLQKSGNNYVNHSTINILIFATDPNIDMCTNAMACIGLWPKQLPKDHLNVEIAQNDLYSFTQNFTVAYSYYNSDCLEQGNRVLNIYRTLYDEIK